MTHIVLNKPLINLNTTLVMAIVNVTPDSFFAESRTSEADDLINRCQKAIDQGAQIIYIGGYSTRPGADFVTPQEELQRITNALKHIRKHFPNLWISVDTFRASVAEVAVKEYGVNIINDVSAGMLDPDLIPLVAKLNIPYVLMHSKGDPQTMHLQTQYQHLIPEILHFFAQKINLLRQSGFTADIIIDPGFGFAKTTQQNFEILHQLEQFQIFQSPLLIGISRKTMIWKTLDITPDESLNGTTVLNTIALQKGAQILRVHDVKEAAQTIKLVQAANPKI